ncbi:hypothetical protein [Catalinimonas niigatensis]|uniref:hypothetical protein n=1 Tax=Catalinimonas niigatensis TaxID=1397264 RepID=UPI002665D3B9|nr:hypothetical protein [Catalinimonas niigatensis]WPP52890.1 hypothetical protein PZB72_10935 [Catalinimonas niigatensis]
MNLCAQFLEDFSEPTSSFHENGLPNWITRTGDGNVIFTQKIEDGHASLRVDASQDKRNIWYAFMHTDVAPALNIKLFKKPHNALRIEARVRPSHAPRRVNLYLSTPRSTNHHINLLEYDLPVANEWYTISMTLDSMEVREGEPLYGQVSMMDWGNSGIYQLDVDYVKVSIVDTLKAEPDQGNATRYRPPLATAESFAISRKVAEDVSIEHAYPTLNLSTWVHREEKVLPLDASKTILLRWDLSDLKGQQVEGEGQLELYTYAVQRLKENPKDFGEVRIVEIIDGEQDWKEGSVTYQSLMQEKVYAEVINEQTTVDTPLSLERAGKTVVTLSPYVLQRLIDGTSLGLAIRPLGLINASLMDSETSAGKYAARLRLNLAAGKNETKSGEN